MARTNVFVELLEKNGIKHENHNKVACWKQCIQSSIAELRRYVAQSQEWSRGKLSNKRVKADLERTYYVKNKGLNVVFEEIKLRIKAKTTKLELYDERNNQFLQQRFSKQPKTLV